MRILLLSDIHANLEALEACLAAAPPHDLVINLGDIVGYGASPNEVADRARALGQYFVRGNHDKACTGLTSLEYFNPIASAAAVWTQQALTPQNYEWLRELPAGPLPVPLVEEQENGPVKTESERDTGPLQPFYCVHGSPLDEDEYIITLHDALEVLKRSNIRLTFFGHTHIQGGFALGVKDDGVVLSPEYAGHDEPEQLDLHLEEQTKYLINPGSVGQPRDGDWRAAFALFDSDASSLTYHRVPYNVKAAQQRILSAKLPERLASRLRDGR